MTFPLEQWFDVTNRISREDLKECRDELLLRAFKDSESKEEYEKTCKELYDAVKAHNLKFKKKPKVKIIKLSINRTKDIRDIKLHYNPNGANPGDENYESMKILEEGCDVYGLVGQNLSVSKFLYWIHYNTDLCPGYPYSWSIFGNRSGVYYTNEEEMLESLQDYHKRLILGSIK